METVGGRYAIDGRLGEGGMGCVYRARHLQLGKPFALKVISPAFALDAHARQRFNEEAKLASEISHPNIVSVVDFGEDPQFGAYMVMELIEGEPLVAENAGPQSIRRTCESLAQIADALDFIHRRGIVHGDVKAENIMLTDEASGPRRRKIARLLDFGLARRPHHDSLGREDQISGSPHYMAPERASGARPSVRADVYALGVLGYLMVGGALPFAGNPVEILMHHIATKPKPLAELRGEEIEGALDALITRAMAKDPDERHSSAAAFRYELNAVMEMLALTQRKRSSTQMIRALPENARDVGLVAAFERSRLPQAFISVKGIVAIANKAFNKLVGRDSAEGVAIGSTSLAEAVPDLLEAVLLTHGTGKSQERKAFVPRGDKTPLELTVWLSPLPIEGQEIHVTVRVIESTSSARR